MEELLKLVDLSDKRDAYPGELSGGQKQRVAIARALANDPQILLSDEATSALDPDATESILKLLKDLNRKLGLTIVIITHEMAVIKSIADKVAVMENGKVVEQGEVYQVFADPKQPITRKFVEASTGLGKLEKLIGNQMVDITEKDTRKLIRLTFTKDSVGEALISQASRKFNVDISIVLANVDVVGDAALGGIVADISGTAESINSTLAFFEASGVKTEVIRK